MEKELTKLDFGKKYIITEGILATYMGVRGGDIHEFVAYKDGTFTSFMTDEDPLLIEENKIMGPMTCGPLSSNDLLWQNKKTANLLGKIREESRKGY